MGSRSSGRAALAIGRPSDAAGLLARRDGDVQAEPVAERRPAGRSGAACSWDAGLQLVAGDEPPSPVPPRRRSCPGRRRPRARIGASGPLNISVEPGPDGGLGHRCPAAEEAEDRPLQRGRPAGAAAAASSRGSRSQKPAALRRGELPLVRRGRARPRTSSRRSRDHGAASGRSRRAAELPARGRGRPRRRRLPARRSAVTDEPAQLAAPVERDERRRREMLSRSAGSPRAWSAATAASVMTGWQLARRRSGRRSAAGRTRTRPDVTPPGSPAAAARSSASGRSGPGRGAASRGARRGGTSSTTPPGGPGVGEARGLDAPAGALAPARAVDGEAGRAVGVEQDGGAAPRRRAPARAPRGPPAVAGARARRPGAGLEERLERQERGRPRCRGPTR